jgi:hypothetical protein
MKKKFRRSMFGMLLASSGAGLAYIATQDYLLVGADSVNNQNSVLGTAGAGAILGLVVAGMLVFCVGAFFLVLAFTDL